MIKKEDFEKLTKELATIIESMPNYFADDFEDGGEVDEESATCLIVNTVKDFVNNKL